MTDRRMKEFYVTRKLQAKGGHGHLFERNGEFAFGPKRLATRFHGRIEADRVRIIISKRGLISTKRTKVVRA